MAAVEPWIHVPMPPGAVISKAPAWVTLEVVTGGFATSQYSAGGPLRDHGRAIAARLGVRATRFALNVHFLEAHR